MIREGVALVPQSMVSMWGGQTLIQVMVPVLCVTLGERWGPENTAGRPTVQAQGRGMASGEDAGIQEPHLGGWGPTACWLAEEISEAADSAIHPGARRQAWQLRIVSGKGQVSVWGAGRGSGGQVAGRLSTARLTAEQDSQPHLADRDTEAHGQSCRTQELPPPATRPFQVVPPRQVGGR